MNNKKTKCQYGSFNLTYYFPGSRVASRDIKAPRERARLHTYRLGFLLRILHQVLYMRIKLCFAINFSLNGFKYRSDGKSANLAYFLCPCMNKYVFGQFSTNEFVFNHQYNKYTMHMLHEFICFGIFKTRASVYSINIHLHQNIHVAPTILWILGSRHILH